MKARGGSFGLILLLVVMGIVLLLVARNWQSIGPTAIAVGRATDPQRAAAQAGVEPGQGEFPDLQKMQQRTSAYSVDAAKAVAESE